MSVTAIVLLSIFATGAAFVQRVCGFGFGIFIMTILPYLMPTYGEATALSGVLAMVTSAIIVARMYKHLSWRMLLPILITFLIVSWFAVLFVASQPDKILRRILGGVLIFASIWFFCLSERIKLKPTIPVQLSMGTLSGIMGGLFGMQGPPAVLYFLGAAKSKEQYVALAQSYFLIGNATMTIYRWHSGFLTANVGKAWLFGLAAVLLGTWIGSIVFRHISAPTLRRLVYTYMGISGLVAIII